MRSIATWESFVLYVGISMFQSPCGDEVDCDLFKRARETQNFSEFQSPCGDEVDCDLTTLLNRGEWMMAGFSPLAGMRSIATSAC